MLRALQDRGIHRGVDIYMEYTVIELLKSGDRVVGALAYDREKGGFTVFHAKAIIIATGGIGKLYKITSNSWDCTCDGHSLAYHAGAELIDMEFVQFHPTGMVWPPSVRGLLVTEGVRGEGGILRNNEGRRFMFDDIPPLYASQTADNEEEGWRYTQGDREARRPPELLTRDHVARCIVREVKEGRGSPHGGVFLDISWIKQKLSNAEAHIKKKLPAMYHQFKRLADIDITQEPMEVGPTTHYAMGGVRVDPDTQMSGVPGLFSAGECTAGLHGANRLGGNSLSDLLVFGKLAGECAARYAEEHQPGHVDPDQVDEAVHRALAPFERADGEGAYDVHKDLQEMMQAQVGIVREGKEMVRAIESFEQLRERAEQVAVRGNRAFNPGWHTAMDLRPLLTVGEAIARAAFERKESRGAHFRNDCLDKSTTEAEVNIVIRKGVDGSMETRREPMPEIPSELRAIIEEMQ